MEPHSRLSDNIDIDHETSRSICDEVGERLQQDLSLEASPLPPYLDRLVDELRKQDEMGLKGRSLFTTSGDSCAGLAYHGPPFWKPSSDLYPGDGFFATLVKNTNHRDEQNRFRHLHRRPLSARPSIHILGRR